MPRVESLLLYPGQVLLEGTNLSEGRGTTTPFELVGAPFINPYKLTRALESCQLPGLKPVPVQFRPTFDKWMGKSCGGVALRVTDPAAVRSYVSTVNLLACIRRLWPNDFEWLPPPYEYELEKMPIDILSGSSRFRETFASDRIDDAAEIEQLAAVDVARWAQRSADCRLYA